MSIYPHSLSLIFNVIIVIITLITLTQGIPVYNDYLRYYVAEHSDPRSIRPLSCHSADGTIGVCMFSLACRHANGRPIGLCKDTIYSGSCCQLPEGSHDPQSLPVVPEVENFLEIPVQNQNRTSPTKPLLQVHSTSSPIPSSSTTTAPSSISPYTSPSPFSSPPSSLSSSPSPLPFSSSASPSSSFPSTTTTTIQTDITSPTTATLTTITTTVTPTTVVTVSTTKASASTLQITTTQNTTEFISTQGSTESDESTKSESIFVFDIGPSTGTSQPSIAYQAQPEITSAKVDPDDTIRPTIRPKPSSSPFSTANPVISETTKSDQQQITLSSDSNQTSQIVEQSSTSSNLINSTGVDQLASSSTSIKPILSSSSSTSFLSNLSLSTDQPELTTIASQSSSQAHLSSSSSPATISTIITSTAATPSSTTTKISSTHRVPSPTVSSFKPSTTTTTTTTTQRIPTLNRITSPSTVAPKNSTALMGIKSICGRKMNGPTARIVGGAQSTFSEWPWMVSTRQWKKNAFLHKCGAALLNEYWAITAAHCVENVAPTDLLLRLGEYDISHEDEPYNHIERRVQIIAPHPKFDPRTFEYDLALLRFYEPVTFRKNILPICIPEGNKSYVGRKATVTGWGRLYEDGPLPNTLQHVDVPVITNQECEMMYRRAGYSEEIPYIFICAGMSSGGKDSCEGDSGGPLVIEENGQWHLIGIISWGIGCALPNQPGVYTRISEFSKWIHQIIAY